VLREGEGFMYTVRSEVLPGFVLVAMGCIDCLTTVIGILYFGAAELNPFMTAIINTSIFAFLALKISATFLIGFTYILAKRTLNKTMNKESRTFKYSSRLIKGAYAGIMVFLIVVVINNLTILLA